MSRAGQLSAHSAGQSKRRRKELNIMGPSEESLTRPSAYSGINVLQQILLLTIAIAPPAIICGWNPTVSARTYSMTQLHRANLRGSSVNIQSLPSSHGVCTSQDFEEHEEIKRMHYCELEKLKSCACKREVGVRCALLLTDSNHWKIVS
jgi:hypothetical protein